jgi:cytochrome P450
MSTQAKAPAPPFAGYSRATIDDCLVNPGVMADADEVHALYTELRAEDPVHWTQPTGYRPFWSLTRHADVLAVSKANDCFVNRLRTYLTPQHAEEWTLATVGDTHLFRSLVDLDDPKHMKLRRLTLNWFAPASLRKLEPEIARIAKRHVDQMAALGGECDFVREVALWYPLRVIMHILGLPVEDEPLMLRMTQEIFGPQDPDVVAAATLVTDDEAAGSGAKQVDLFAVVQEYFKYFNAVTVDRRANPRDDLSTVIATGMIDGEPIGELEAISYYVIAATAGHDTTSSTAAGGLRALIENPAELAKLKANPELIPQAIEEMIRWVTPVKHFMRTATEDCDVGGQAIKAGDALALFYWSANRDAAVFDDPFAFKVDRTPNAQIAFGHGVHMCLGLHLARMELRALFAELLPRLDEIALNGEPKNSTSNFVSGLKTLPIRYRMR